jgi:sulfhydrogenase subunit beta (sulfur reductase)
MGFLTFGPKVNNGTIIYDQIRGVTDLPIGYRDQQEPGSYRLIKGKQKTFFGYVVGPHTLRKYLRPPTETICEVKRNRHELTMIRPKEKKSRRALLCAKPFSVAVPERKTVKRAILGVRPCELQALAVYDTVFGKGPHVDEVYLHDRENTFVVSVNCTNPGDTCFCTSMNTGPKANSGFDLSLTELIDSDRHCFLIEAGSSSGAALLSELPAAEPTEADIAKSEKVLQQSARRIKRSLDSDKIKEMLYGKFDDPCWEEIASRCLSCGNCTMVCPTCFCITVEDRTDLSGDSAERKSRWDSCHTLDYSYIHGGNIRPSVASRYRQWMMHKLAYWLDQFDTSGCVGCGRCITWCPAGIDITEEARLLREKS